MDIIVAEDQLELNLNVTNLVGQMMKDQKLDLFKGKNTVELNAKDYAQGMYLIHLINSSKDINLEQKFIKQ
jgi:hypothetical protein